MASLRGVDLSNNNGSLPPSFWAGLKRANIGFVYYKATEGLAFSDATYGPARKQAAAEGIPFGAYHFLHANLDGEAQAAYFLKYAKPKPGDLRPVIDAESRDGKTDPQIGHVILACALAIEKAGFAPIVYGSPGFLRSVVAAVPALATFDHWEADYGVSKPILGYFKRTLVWQDTDGYPLYGRKVDGDVFLGASLAQLLIPPKKAAKPAPKTTPLPGPVPKPKWFWPALKMFLANRKEKA